MIRWMSLYHLRTGQAPAADAPLPRVWLSAIVRESTDLLRLTKHLLTRPDRRRPKTQFFAVAQRWLTYPFVLPWQLYWEWRFRRKAAPPS